MDDKEIESKIRKENSNKLFGQYLESIKAENLVNRYPFMKKILSLEQTYLTENIIFLEGIIDSELLEKKSHRAEYRQDEGLPAYRIYSINPSMPDKEGPVPTYAIKGDTLKKLGLEWQLVDKEYIDEGYDAEARLNDNPNLIQEELSIKGIENPDYIVCRDRNALHLKFEIYRRKGE